MKDLMESDLSKTSATIFLQTLKKSTAPLHILLESNQLMAALIGPQVTIRDYGCYLILMQDIMMVYENELPVFFTIDQRKNSKLIANDLHSIGYTLPKNSGLTHYSLPVKKIATPFAWGFAYVMEGSKLGGKVIFKHIQRQLGFSENSGASFIAGDGVNTFGLWKEFLLKFSAYVTQNSCEDEAIQGAEYAFKSIYNFFEINRSLYEV